MGALLTGGIAETSLVITSEMLAPITDAITGNLGVLLPVGIGIMAIMIGIHLVPRIIYKFF